MPITALPDPPSPADTPATFNSKAFTFLGAMANPFVGEVNAAVATVNAKEASAVAAAIAALASEAAADASEAAALVSKNAAAASETAAAGSAAAAASLLDAFDDRYLGAKAGDPAVDNDGNAVLGGALYWNTTVGEMRVWTGSAWVSALNPVAVADNLFSLKGSADPTKIAKFEVDGFTAGVTRTFTLPDASTTLVGTDVAQTLSNKTLTSPVITGGATVSGDIQQDNANYLKGKLAAGTATRLFGLNSSNNLFIGSIDAAHSITMLVNGGAEHARIDASGNVSIGSTASSGQRLKVTGPAASPIAALFEDGANAARLRIYVDDTAGVTLNATNTANAAKPIVFTRGASTESMRIDAAGNLGVGTDAPETPLHVNGVNGLLLSQSMTDATQKNGRLRSKHYTNAEEPVTALIVASSATDNTVYIGGGISTDNAATNLRFYTAANTTTITGTERMRLDASGNLLIGTTATGASKLVVADNSIQINSPKTPATAAATGTQGQVCWDANYLYACVATNSWRRAALAAW